MEVLIKPIITEKMTMLTEKHNQYGFVVNKKSTKPQIKATIEKLYNVKVLDISTSIRTGKTKRRRTKSGLVEGKSSAYKKAIATLKEGDKIDFYSNI
jgi:large subunit ribosomal protein L23